MINLVTVFAVAALIIVLTNLLRPQNIRASSDCVMGCYRGCDTHNDLCYLIFKDEAPARVYDCSGEYCCGTGCKVTEGWFCTSSCPSSGYCADLVSC